jgi:hypothetical protein
MRTVRRASDMPLYGRITRLAKGRYEVIIKFVASKRTLHKEQLSLPTRDAVKQFYLREYPTLTWGEPKYAKPRLKIVRSKPVKKVTRKGKPRKGKTNARPRVKRLRH